MPRAQDSTPRIRCNRGINSIRAGEEKLSERRWEDSTGIPWLLPRAPFSGSGWIKRSTLGLAGSGERVHEVFLRSLEEAIRQTRR